MSGSASSTSASPSLRARGPGVGSGSTTVSSNSASRSRSGSPPWQRLRQSNGTTNAPAAAAAVLRQQQVTNVHEIEEEEDDGMEKPEVVVVARKHALRPGAKEPKAGYRFTVDGLKGDAARGLAGQEPWDPNPVADVSFGLWTCCRVALKTAPRCRKDYHLDDHLVCRQCGRLEPRREFDRENACIYHPGDAVPHKAGGVRWSCCDTVGLDFTVGHSAKGAHTGPETSEDWWRWGCKRARHTPKYNWSVSEIQRRYEHATKDDPVKSAGMGPVISETDYIDDAEQFLQLRKRSFDLRLAAITVFTNTAERTITGVMSTWESDGVMVNGNAHGHKAGNGEERLELDIDDHIVRVGVRYQTANAIDDGAEVASADNAVEEILVVTEKGRVHQLGFARPGSLLGEIDVPNRHRLIGFAVRSMGHLVCLSLETCEMLMLKSKGSQREIKRCTRCALFFTELSNPQNSCKFHPGVWSNERRVRLAHIRNKCLHHCSAPGCEKTCVRGGHPPNIPHDCQESRTKCAAWCNFPGCESRCAIPNHWHAFGPHATEHQCKVNHLSTCTGFCICGKTCFWGPRIRHLRCKCRAADALSCPSRCHMPNCPNTCSHYDHFHSVTPGVKDEDHNCGQPHPCAEQCDAPLCEAKCGLFADRKHNHDCKTPGIKCLHVCSEPSCTAVCTLEHFHGLRSDHHACGIRHPCLEACEAPGCIESCAKFVDTDHGKTHSCASEQCNQRCSVMDCDRTCQFPDHLHGLEAGVVHDCTMPHPCRSTCSGSGCELLCKLDCGEHPDHDVHQCQPDAALLRCSGTCSVPGCDLACVNTDHFHGLQHPPGGNHYCGQVHTCPNVCDLPNLECVWKGEKATKARKPCVLVIAPYQLKHIGTCQCDGMHRKPVDEAVEAMRIAMEEQAESRKKKEFGEGKGHGEDDLSAMKASIQCSTICRRDGCRRRCATVSKGVIAHEHQCDLDDCRMRCARVIDGVPCDRLCSRPHMHSTESGQGLPLPCDCLLDHGDTTVEEVRVRREKPKADARDVAAALRAANRWGSVRKWIGNPAGSAVLPQESAAWMEGMGGAVGVSVSVDGVAIPAPKDEHGNRIPSPPRPKPSSATHVGSTAGVVAVTPTMTIAPELDKTTPTAPSTISTPTATPPSAVVGGSSTPMPSTPMHEGNMVSMASVHAKCPLAGSPMLRHVYKKGPYTPTPAHPPKPPASQRKQRGGHMYRPSSTSSGSTRHTASRPTSASAASMTSGHSHDSVRLVDQRDAHGTSPPISTTTRQSTVSYQYPFSVNGIVGGGPIAMNVPFAAPGQAIQKMGDLGASWPALRRRYERELAKGALATTVTRASHSYKRYAGQPKPPSDTATTTRRPHTHR